MELVSYDFSTSSPKVPERAAVDAGVGVEWREVPWESHRIWPLGTVHLELVKQPGFRGFNAPMSQPVVRKGWMWNIKGFRP